MLVDSWTQIHPTGLSILDATLPLCTVEKEFLKELDSYSRHLSSPGWISALLFWFYYKNSWGKYEASGEPGLPIRVCEIWTEQWWLLRHLGVAFFKPFCKKGAGQSNAGLNDMLTFKAAITGILESFRFFCLFKETTSFYPDHGSFLF